ncbi:MAG: relaxase/mobilization nuclease domain-containing protein [Rhizobiaceae bacterium]|nr:relaxase/mobilization nuclease domain-containing protein [Rhizobiaceae bacterium]
MILDGSQRGGARDLAIHLMKPENEHIELHEIRGFAGDTIMEALREAEAVSRGTKCRKHLYALSLSPPEMADVPVSAFESAIDRIEEKLGLVDHPRVIVFHEKNGRRHAHCVWSRIDGNTMTAVRMSHDRYKLADISRQLYLEHGWKMPEGLIDRDLRNPLNFERKEWFQAKSVGKDPRHIKNALQQCWAASDSGKAFRSALEQRGYWLAQGDKRVVAVDIDGEVYAVARWIGVKTRDVVARTSDIEALPNVDKAQEHVSSLVRDKLASFIRSASDEFAQAAELLEGRRIAMVERHRKARRELELAQRTRSNDEARRRTERFRKGILGLWDWVTGKHAELRRQNEAEAATCAERDVAEKQALIQVQLQERQRLQEDIRRERQEATRAVTMIHRQMYSASQQSQVEDRTDKHKKASRRRGDRSRSLRM